MINKKISVLVPIYGVEKYIEKCALSLFSQTYDNIEYIFVNDCTKDDSIEVLKSVLESYPHRLNQVKIINHDINRGLAAARKTALANATGDYIYHVDSDDCLPENSLELLIKEAVKTEADIVDGAYQTFTSNGIDSSISKPYHGGKESYLKLILCRCGILPNNIWGRLIKRSLYIKHGIDAIEGVDFAEDYSVIPCLLFYARRTYIDETVYFYRKDNINSYVHNLSEKNFISIIKARKHVYEFFSDNDVDHTFAFETQLSILHLFRVAHEYKLSSKLIYTHFHFKPSGSFLRFYEYLLRKHYFYFLSSIIYLGLRTFKYRKLMDCHE